MSDVARRYVKPLFEVARDAKALDQVEGDLKQLDQALASSKELRTFLSAPIVERATKKSLLEKLFKEASPYTLNFLRVVIAKNRSEVLAVTYRIYCELLNEHRGITPGLVESAVPLDEAVFGQIQREVSRVFGGKIQLGRKVDPELMGGVRVRVGNRVMDASVRARLEKLRAVLKGE